jgi:large subunit ribosomal protein L29
MKQDIVKDLTTDEIRDRIIEERGIYTKIKLSHAVSPIENPLKIRGTRRLIARLETEYKKRLMTAQEAVKK